MTIRPENKTKTLFFLKEHAKELEELKMSLKYLFKEAPLPEIRDRYCELIEKADDLLSFIKAKIEYYETL